MNRRLFFKAMAGIAALLTSARKMVARKPEETFTISCANDLPVAFGCGDRLSVSFSAYPSRVDPFVSFTVDTDGPISEERLIMPPLRTANEQIIFIAPRECMITDIRIATANGAPVHWKRTGDPDRQTAYLEARLGGLKTQCDQ